MIKFIIDDQGILLYTVGSDVRKLFLKTNRDVSLTKHGTKRVVGVAMSSDKNTFYYSTIDINATKIMRGSHLTEYSEVIADTGNTFINESSGI